MSSEHYSQQTSAQIQQWEKERKDKIRLECYANGTNRARAFQKLRKQELIDLLMSLDVYDPSVRWSIEAGIRLKKPLELVSHDLRQAIENATKVDHTKMKINFDYRLASLRRDSRGFQMLVALNELEVAANHRPRSHPQGK